MSEMGKRRGDNLRSGPVRLLGVGERDALEQSLRRCLADEATSVRPSRSDLAAPPISAGRRIQRRRNLVAMAAVVAATLLASGVMLRMSDAEPAGGYGVAFTAPSEDPAPASPNPTVSGPAGPAVNGALADETSLDVVGVGVAGDLVLATSGQPEIDLAPVRGVVSAHRVAGGWAVVSRNADTRTLWWVTGRAEPTPVVAAVEALVVEHERVAWRRGRLLYVAVLSGTGELEQQTRTAAPAGGADPVGFLGETVLLARGEDGPGDTGGGLATWSPGQGDHQPAWSQRVVRVYGLRAGGPTAVGLVSGAEPASGGSQRSESTDRQCLALLDVDRDLAVERTACLPGLSPGGAAAISPDGRWLVAATDGSPASDQPEPAAPTPEAAFTAGPPLLVDLDAAFADEPDPDAGTEISAVPGPSGAPVWLGPATVLFPTVDGIARLWPQRLGTADVVETVDLPDGPPVLVAPR